MSEDKSECCIGIDGPCFNKAKRRRQNTAYVDDSKNWVFMCDGCAETNKEYWDEMWQELKSDSH